MKKALIFIIAVVVACLFGGTTHADLNDGLMAYYPFNGNANDESGNGKDGTVYDAILTEDRFENPNSAYSFNGTNAYIQTPVSESQLPLTLSAWFKTNDANKGQAIVDGDKCYYNGHSMHLNIAYGSGIDAEYHDGVVYSGYKVVADEWYHVAVVFDGTTETQTLRILIYVNGEKELEETVTRNLSLDGDPFRIGKHCSTDNRWFDGLIDDVRIYCRVLSDNEIASLYNEDQEQVCCVSCWDLNENGIEDPEEDFNLDGSVNVLDCIGPEGPPGPPGEPADPAELEALRNRVEVLESLVNTIINNLPRLNKNKMK